MASPKISTPETISPAIALPLPGSFFLFEAIRPINENIKPNGAVRPNVAQPIIDNARPALQKPLLLGMLPLPCTGCVIGVA